MCIPEREVFIYTIYSAHGLASGSSSTPPPVGAREGEVGRIERVEERWDGERVREISKTHGSHQTQTVLPPLCVREKVREREGVRTVSEFRNSPISQVYINDFCSRPRWARPDTVLTEGEC